MNKFDELNRQTREYNSRFHGSETVTTSATKTKNTSFSYFQHLNNQTYKANNGVYSQHYY